MTRVFVINDDELSSVEYVSTSTEGAQSNRNKHLKKNIEPLESFRRSSSLPSELLTDDITYHLGDDSTKNQEMKSNIPRVSRTRRNKMNYVTSLELENLKHGKIKRKRKETFQSLISGFAIEVSWINGVFTTIGIIVAGFPATFLYTLVPAHNLITHPEFWWEILLHGTGFNTLRSIAFSTISSWFTNISQLRKPKTLAISCLFSNLVTTSWLVIGYYVWTHIFHYQYPIPFVGWHIYGIGIFTILMCFFLKCPKAWRQNHAFKSRMKYFLILIHHVILLDIANTVVTQILRRYRNQYQPIIALLLPLNRELTLLFFHKIIRKTTNGDDNGAEIILNYGVTTLHMIWTCYNLGTFTTNVTAWVLMSIDFSLNILLCLRIVWTKVRNGHKINERISTLQELAAYELAEFHAPLSFMFMFIVAYYGPNSELFLNISSTYWGSTPIKDIRDTMDNMAIFFLVDFCSTIVSALMLWYFCKINLWKVFLVLQKEFGIIFGIILGDFVYIVSILSYFLSLFFNWHIILYT